MRKVVTICLIFCTIALIAMEKTDIDLIIEQLKSEDRPEAIKTLINSMSRKDITLDGIRLIRAVVEEKNKEAETRVNQLQQELHVRQEQNKKHS